MKQWPYKTILNYHRLCIHGSSEQRKVFCCIVDDGDLSAYRTDYRFDIALVLRDRRDEELDGKVADHILDNYSGRHKSDNDNGWNLQELKNYFAFIKKLRPQMTKDAEEYLMRLWPVHIWLCIQSFRCCCSNNRYHRKRIGLDYSFSSLSLFLFLCRQYQIQRENQEIFGTRTTLRKLESLIRLSKGEKRADTVSRLHLNELVFFLSLSHTG